MHSRACVLVALLSLFFIPVALAQTAETMPYLNPGLSTEQRVDDLISRMTLDEKASQLVNQARAIPRLQIPEYDWWSEALHGVAMPGRRPCFPNRSDLAATFDDPLIHEMAVVIGTEAALSTIRRCAPAAATSWKGSTSGRPTSISSVIRGGGAARKPTARIHFLPARWEWHSLPDCRATIPSITG